MAVRDGPGCVGLGANEDGALGEFAEMEQEAASDAAFLVVGADVGVADERDVVHVLQAHDSQENSVFSK